MAPWKEPTWSRYWANRQDLMSGNPGGASPGAIACENETRYEPTPTNFRYSTLTARRVIPSVLARGIGKCPQKGIVSGGYGGRSDLLLLGQHLLRPGRLASL
jgi:hypothetical protein